VIRTSVPAEQLDAAGTVQAYKDLSRVERAIRSLKSVDLDIRPIRPSEARAIPISGAPARLRLETSY
jgi:hypothetical protein